MKKKGFLWAVLALILISFSLYFYSFTGTDAGNLYLTVDYEKENGWEIVGVENTEEVPLTATQAIDYNGTVFLRRTVSEEWMSYSRIHVDSGRAVLVFVDDSLVFSNHQTALTSPGELPLMQMPVDQPFSLVFSMQPSWVGKTVTVVTRLYEGKAYGSIGFDLVSDDVALLQHEAWVNQKVLPGMAFGVLSLLLLGLFLFELSTRKKGFPLLFLALASLMQMLSYMSVLSGNPLPMIESDITTALYFLFPLLYLGTKLTRSKKAYFIAVLCSWGVYFSLFAATFIFYLPVPYWFDKVELLCFIPLGIMVAFCLRERRANPFSRRFLSLLLMFGAGYLLLFLVTAALHSPLHQTIVIIFKEAFSLYCRPLLFWIFTTILFVLFILAVWNLLQERIHAAKQMERLQGEQAILHLQIESARDQLDSLRTANEQAAVHRHDLRHHFSLLSGFAEEGNMQKIKDYLVAAQGELDDITPTRYCENQAANLILSAFAGRAKQEGVSLLVDAKLPYELAVPDTELCAVLSNGLENAISAAVQVENAALRTVRVTCSVNRNNLLIMIENPYIGDIEMENGIPVSDKEGHGFGCRSIAAIADRRKGYYTFKVEGGVFTLRVVLPME